MERREGYATTEEVAAYLAVSPRTLGNWAYLGKGPDYIKIDGGARRYAWEAVHAWIEQRTVRHG